MTRKPPKPLRTLLVNFSISVAVACSGMNWPWHSGQERPQPSADPVFVTVAPMISTKMRAGIGKMK